MICAKKNLKNTEIILKTDKNAHIHFPAKRIAGKWMRQMIKLGSIFCI